MPAELEDIEVFVKLSERAESCRIKRSGEVVKLKLRTPGRLYTLKVDKGKAEELIKNLKCETIEV